MTVPGGRDEPGGTTSSFNPACGEDWVVHTTEVRTPGLQRAVVRDALRPSDLLAGDLRFAR